MKTICYWLLFCFLVTEFASTADSKVSCVDGFTYLRLSRNCIRVVYESLTWDGANKRCPQVHNGSHLIAITSAKKNRAIKTFLENEMIRSRKETVCTYGKDGVDWMFWTGGREFIQDGNQFSFVWHMPGNRVETFDYTNWHSDYPSYFPGAICLKILPEQDFEWYNDTCDYEICPVCEYKP